MFFSVGSILKSLSEWPLRPTGSEEEMLARETLTMYLEGIPDIRMVEEGFWAPTSTVPFLLFMAGLTLLAVWFSETMPYIGLLAGLVVSVSYSFFRLGLKNPLLWIGPKKMTANLSASKGKGDTLVILTANLDTAPLDYRKRPESHSLHMLFAVLSYSAFMSGFGAALCAVIGIPLTFWGQCCLTVLLLFDLTFSIFSPLLADYRSRADNVTGVAAAMGAAERLMIDPPPETEIRLLITTAKEQGMLGMEHYLTQHQDDFRLKYKEVCALSFDRLDNGPLCFRGTGQHKQKMATISLAQAAQRLSKSIQGVSPVDERDEVVFLSEAGRFSLKGFDALTLFSDKKNILVKPHPMPTLGENIERAIEFSVNIIQIKTVL